MKLELKHLAGYLPYELKGVFKLTDVVAYSVKELNNNRVKVLNIDNVDFFLDYCKPILRPIPDLTKYKEFDNYYILSDIEEGFMVKRINETYTRINELNFLYENHFDIYGLIENNLAIDINTSNKTNE